MSTSESLAADREAARRDDQGPQDITDIVGVLERKVEIADDTLHWLGRRVDQLESDGLDLSGLRKTIRNAIAELDKLWPEGT